MSNQPPTGAPPTDAPVAGAFVPPARQKPASAARYKRELRKETKRRAIEPEINFLNITAMLDMMTIILVFLLKTATSTTGSLPQNADLRLPTSLIVADLTKEPDGLFIQISRTKIVVGKDEILTEIAIPGDAANYGADLKDKAKDRNDLYIIPLGKAIRPWRNNDKDSRAASGKPGASEAIIMADQATPYRLLAEVLHTLGQNEFGQFHLLVMQPAKQ